MDAKNRRRVKNFYLGASQMKLAVGLTFIFGMFFFAAGFLILGSLLADTAILANQYSLQAAFHNDLAGLLRSSIIKMIIAGTILTALLILAAVIISHRFYGPIIQMSAFARRIGSGDYKARVHLRKGDELQDFAKDLNDMAEALENRHK